MKTIAYLYAFAPDGPNIRDDLAEAIADCYDQAERLGCIPGPAIADVLASDGAHPNLARLLDAIRTGDASVVIVAR